MSKGYGNVMSNVLFIVRGLRLRTAVLRSIFCEYWTKLSVLAVLSFVSILDSFMLCA